MDFFVGEMNKYHQKINQTDSFRGSTGQENPGVTGPGLPPAENPVFAKAGRPLLLLLPPAWYGPAIVPSPPPDYRAVRAEMRLANLKAALANLQQGLKNDFQSQSFQHGMSAAELEISQLAINLPVNLQGSYGKAKADFKRLQQQLPKQLPKQLPSMNERVLVKEFHQQIDRLQQSLAEKEPRIENSCAVRAVKREVHALANQIDKLSSVESEKAVLQVRKGALTISIDNWFAVLDAFDTLTRLKSYLEGLQFLKLSQDVDYFSARLDQFDDNIRKILPGETRNELMRESGKLRSVFSDKFKSQTDTRQTTVSKRQPSFSEQSTLENVHEKLRTEPPKSRPVLVHGDILASFASELGCKKLRFFSDGFISTASLGIKPSSEKTKCLVTWTTIPLKSLPSDFQARMIEAYNDSYNWPEDITLLQVYAFATDKSDFNGASFQLELESLMPDFHHRIYRNSRDGRNYSPMGADLRMPEGLKQGNRFYEAHRALHENLAREDTVSFAYGSGVDNHGNLEDIGFTPGASAQEAASAEAGFGIPFGIDLKKQPESLLYELEQQRTGDYRDFEVPDGDEPDSDVVSDSLGSSGINSVALQPKGKYQISARARASEIFAKEVGILWVKTITALPDVNSPCGLMDWVQNNKPDPGNLRIPPLL
ncbi:hypothetical protein [Endozoicomonas sp. SESOKO1]|uniref:hypothetical protein n=1 Tax=Endozoicomonas sp. SESOKO1 TaxID=2828742 RepID=UPI0021494CE9|nr:hypothetical protein [Endozoicomonas sp. SESOKO1]